jgi:hypothetical protein
MSVPVVSLATAKVSWTDPTTNTDGSAVTSGEIAGYIVGAGTSSGAYTSQANVTGPTATSVALSALSPVLTYGSTYYLAVKSTGSAPGTWSNEIQFTVAQPTVSAPTNPSVG